MRRPHGYSARSGPLMDRCREAFCGVALAVRGQTGLMQYDAEQKRLELTLMPEYGVDVPVWYGPGGEESGGLDAEELRALGVSDRLIERLRAWQQSWDHDPFTSSPTARVMPGSPVTLKLAQHLQAELPGYRIFLMDNRGPRPIDEWIS
jgi:hypothetical protein